MDEALVRSGKTHCHVIFWTSYIEDYEEIKKFENSEAIS